MNDIDKTLLLAPNYVKDVVCNFSMPFDVEAGEKHKKITITLEINIDEATHLRNLPGMDDQQFVAFLTPCIQTSIYKILQQGLEFKKNNVVIEEKADGPDDEYDEYGLLY